MNDIKCPHCGKVFKVDEAGFADMLKQVRDHQFEKELNERLELAEREKNNAIQLSESKFKSTLQEELAKKDKELTELKASKDQEIARSLAKKDAEVVEIRSKLDKVEIEQELIVTRAVGSIEKERDDLKVKLHSKEQEVQLREVSLKERYENELKMKDEVIERYKDMKLRLSTKMVGETLEQHCEIEFNRLRAAAFKNAYFEKDNDVSSGSKGDYIYREADIDGNEIISIMFEMKNEGDETVTKKRNEDFLRELDKDRNEKKCEYAVLVSLLEAESELYNSGIVDVSHKYARMYIIRPQFFIPIITLLRNAALNSLKYKSELAMVRAQNIDVTNFESQLNDFRESFGRNYRLASEKFRTAIDSIDKSIIQLQKTKESLMRSEDNLRIANSKADDLTVKRLTRGNPTMSAKFEEISSASREA